MGVGLGEGGRGGVGGAAQYALNASGGVGQVAGVLGGGRAGGGQEAAALAVGGREADDGVVAMPAGEFMEEMDRLTWRDRQFYCDQQLLRRQFRLIDAGEKF